MFRKNRLVLTILSMFLMVGVLYSKENTKLRIGALKGPTSMGLVSLFDKIDKDENLNYSYNILASPEAIMAEIGSNNLDIATVPANMASIIYNKTNGKYKIIDINTLGMLYMVSNNEEVKSIEGLKNRTIYTMGKGAVPEYTLRTILAKNGLDPDKDVQIEFKSEAQELVPILIKNKNAIVMIPQPFLTAAMSKNENIKVIFSMNDLWNDMKEDSKLVQGTTIVNAEFLKDNKELVDKFLDEHKASIEFINENVDEGAKLVAHYGIVPEMIAKKAIPKSNMNYIDGSEMEKTVSAYLETLFKQNPKSVGGKLPGKDFYYAK